MQSVVPAQKSLIENDFGDYSRIQITVQQKDLTLVTFGALCLALNHQTFSSGINDFHGTSMEPLAELLKFLEIQEFDKNFATENLMILIPVAYYCFLLVNLKGLDFSTQYYLFLLFDI